MLRTSTELLGQSRNHFNTFSLTTVPLGAIFALSFWYRKYFNNDTLGSIISNESKQRTTIS